MSEEEKEALEKLNKLLEDWENNDITEIELFRINKLIEKQQKELEQEKEKNKNFKKSLLYMINQFAYDEKRNKEEDEPLYTGGLGALEGAFDILNIDEGIARKNIWNMIQELLEEEQ